MGFSDVGFGHLGILMDLELTDVEARVALGAIWGKRVQVGQTMTPIIAEQTDAIPATMRLLEILDSIAEKLGGDPAADFYGIPPPRNWPWAPGASGTWHVEPSDG